MLFWSITFLLGIAFPTTWSIAPSMWTLSFIITLSLITVSICSTYYPYDLKIISAFLLGVWWFCYQFSIYTITLSNAHFNKPIVVSGRITSFPDVQSKRTTFEYIVHTIDHKPCQAIPVVLSDYHYNNSHVLPLKRGEYWQFCIRLKRVRGFWNLGSFDKQAWLLSKGILATGTITKKKQAIRLSSKLKPYSITHFCNSMIDTVYQWRLQLGHYLLLHVKNKECVGLLQALVIGERNRILEEQWEVMRITGTNHLFAISGLHIGFVGGMFYSLTRFFWFCIPSLALWMPMQQAACIGAWVGACLYSMLSGFALPIQRALIMFTSFTGVILKRRTVSIWDGWSAALLIVLCVNPFVVLSESFWLSFGAVGTIFYGLGNRLRVIENASFIKNLWKEWGKTQWIINIGLLPMTLWFFQQLSIIGFVVNLVAIPCIGFIVLPTGLLGSLLYPIWPNGFSFLIIISAKCLLYLWRLLTYLSSLPFAHSILVIPNGWILCTMGLSILLFIAPIGFPGRYYLGSIGLLPLLLYSPSRPKSNEFWLTVLDVGQGLSAIIRTHRHTLIYDTGPSFGDRLDAGNAVVLPYLRYFGIKKIDKLIISHGDNDHSGGAKSIVNAMPVHSILTSELARSPVSKACACHRGQAWNWDGIEFSIIHPGEEQLKSNDRSCVLKVSNGVHHLLLPGDIHRKGEKILLKSNPNLHAITFLVAPHHGSKTSSSPALIQQLSPKHVLFSVGAYNRFSFPSTTIVNRYKDYKARLYSTDQHGMITICFGKTDHAVTIGSFYEHYKKIWHQPPR